MKEPDRAAADREGLLRRVAEVLGGAEHHRVETPQYRVLHLEPATGADYAFRVWIYDDGEPQLSARLMAGLEDDHFWSKAFELPDYRSVEARNSAFLEILERLVTCPTRITQTKGWLFWDLHCDVRIGNAWAPVGGYSAGRWIPGMRDTGRKQTVYSSPAVRAGAGAV